MNTFAIAHAPLLCGVTHFDFFKVPRSSGWTKFRNEVVADHPFCAACGGSSLLNVHHIIPFHEDHSKELERSNVIVLCEGSRGVNCHFSLGHSFNWKAFQPDVVKMAKEMFEYYSSRKGVDWKPNA